MTTATIFIISMLSLAIDILPALSALKYLSPIKYFDAKIVMSNGVELQFMILSILISAALIFTAYRNYPKRDLSI